MRLFLFLVGGTGSRVLRPLIMQFAAGVRPLDNNGKEIPLEVVPIIIDPHKANEDLKRTDSLLRSYKSIRRSIYGENVEVGNREIVLGKEQITVIGRDEVVNENRKVEGK